MSMIFSTLLSKVYTRGDVGCPEKRPVQKTDCGVFILIPRGFQDIVIIVYEQTFNGFTS
jgi:hypothetical protein